MLLVVSVFIATTNLFGQEFNCRVEVNTQQISGTDKAIYERFRRAVQDYMNTTHFSNITLSTTEKIDCSLMFTFKKRSGDLFTCDMSVQSSRPVYGSMYATSLLNFREECQFEFQESKTLTFQLNTVNDNLTATLNFWAFTILGLDFDSFTLLAGTPFYQKAQDIASMARGVLGDNWKAQEDKNHWGWINVLTNENQTEMRRLSYQYHRRGLDSMYLNASRGRTNILESLKFIAPARKAKSSSPLLSNFLETKSDELINVFSKASQEEKTEAFELLRTQFPAATNKLQSIKNYR
jgi:hypothetical protein